MKIKINEVGGWKVNQTSWKAECPECGEEVDGEGEEELLLRCKYDHKFVVRSIFDDEGNKLKLKKLFS